MKIFASVLANVFINPGRSTRRAQFHRATKQLIFGLLYVFHFIALLTVKHRERHANLPAVIASKYMSVTQKS